MDTALAPALPASAAPPQVGSMIAVAAIAPSPTNPRRHFDPATMAELTASVKAHGVLQAVLLRPLPREAKDSKRAAYELVAGERRWRAARAAGVETIPAVIRTLTDLQVLEIQIIENAQRDDLHPLEEADGYEQLRRVHQYSAEQIAEKVGKSRSWVFNRLKLLALCPEAKHAFLDGKLSTSIAELVARIGHHDTQRAALKDITKESGYGPMSFREAREHIQETYMLALKEAPFDTKIEYWWPPKGSELRGVRIAGPCADCPKRTGNQPELFPDVKSGDVCTDPKCFADKRAAHFAQQRAAAEAKGLTVIAGKDAKKIAPHGLEYGAPKGYVKLDDEEWIGNARRKWRQVLGKDVTPTLIEDAESGELVECVEQAQVNKVLREKGLKTGYQSADNSYSAEQRARQKKAQLETSVRMKVLEAVRAAVKGKPGDRQDLVLIAQAMFAEIWHENRKKVLQLWGWEEKANAEKATNTRIAALAADELRIFLIDCALVRDVHVGAWDRAEKNDRLHATAARLKINVEKIRKDLVDAAKAKAKPAKKQITTTKGTP